MSLSHLTELRTQLERRHWKIIAETRISTTESSLSWTIARPNGDSPTTLEFTNGFYGAYGDFRHETIDDSIACNVVGHPEIPHLYFGKFQGQFQKDVVAFADAINEIG